MESVLRKHNCLLLVLFSVLTLITGGCITAPGYPPEPLFTVLPSDGDIYGTWKLSQDQQGRNAIETHLGLSPSVIKRIDTIYFTTKTGTENRQVTALITGRWTNTFLSLSLRASRDWYKKNGVFYSSEPGLELRLFDGYILLSNYSIIAGELHTAGEAADTDLLEFYEKVALISEDYFFAVHSTGAGLPPFLSRLNIEELVCILDEPKEEFCRGTLEITFSTEKIRRLMTPLVKMAFIGFIMDSSMKLPESEYNGEELLLKNFDVPYKKLLDSFLPLFIENENVVHMERG